MKSREKYLKQLKLFKDRDLIKVVTGARRCGKSSLLSLMQADLLADGVDPSRIVSLKMESMEFDSIKDYRDLYHLIRGRTEGITKPYIFLDELQDITKWEKAINSLRVDIDCDIYITGSNAYLLSSEISTLLSGRYVEIEMLPLTFREYLDFRGAIWQPKESENPYHAEVGESTVPLTQLFADFCEYGGFPFLAFNRPTRDEHRLYMKSLYDTVIVRDIVERKRYKQEQSMNQATLEKICRFLADNVGNINSINSIANSLRSENSKMANDTVARYIEALQNAYLFYGAQRYDIKGKELLKTNEKNYIVDCGLRSYLDGYSNSDRGRVLENIIYLQLLYDGWRVNIGKLGTLEVDFLASRDDEKLYIQVCENVESSATLDRELAPLKKIKDAYPKIVLVQSGSHPSVVDGVRIVNVIDFLLGRQ